MKQTIRQYLEEHQRVLARLSDQAESLAGLAQVMRATLDRGGRILVFGNGGSAADAQHFCAELVGGFRLKNGHRPAVALGADAAVLTALGNDFGFDKIFALQVEALASAEDLVLGLTTSGRSSNVLEGLRAARCKGAATACLCGARADLVSPLCDQVVSVPSEQTSHIQEAHGVILHICALLIEQAAARESQR
ncbi:MAG: D-sedoheptulose 7-phosphate isomerase [Geothermobacteraceae bacterium]|nr:MAG: SIS domain-containing protein [Deltaproteobacteria bacterium]